jgi:hypothetical protein
MKNKLKAIFLEFYFCHTIVKTGFAYFIFLKNFGKAEHFILKLLLSNQFIIIR